ncbi:MAG: metal-dependent hydrolase, partial [Halorientalis sp.]
AVRPPRGVAIVPSTVVHAGFALALAAALLRSNLDRRVLAAVVALAVVPDLDSLAGFALPGAHRALGHTLVWPATVAALIYYDARVRERSWLRARWGPDAVALAWALLVAYVFGVVLLDYAHLEGVNLFYPLFDQFFRLEGSLTLSATDGVVQTFVDVSRTAGAQGGRGDTLTVDVGAVGSTETVHVGNPVQPRRDSPLRLSLADRTAPVAVGGWQLYLVGLGTFLVVARRFQSDPPAE